MHTVCIKCAYRVCIQGSTGQQRTLAIVEVVGGDELADGEELDVLVVEQLGGGGGGGGGGGSSSSSSRRRRRRRRWSRSRRRRKRKEERQELEILIHA